MADRIRLFISAGPELEPEREAIGRALAEFPINLGWEIKRTPRLGERVDLEAVRHCDIFVLLFASDIRAPVGLEWMIAGRGERLRLAFLKDGAIRTPAGQEFARNLRKEWRSFQAGWQLVQQLLEALIAHILERWQELGLSSREWETLATYPTQLKGEESEEGPEVKPAGAGYGGVILAPGRDAPGGEVVGS